MRKLLFCLLAGFGFSLQAAYQDAVLADAPVAYWRLGDPADATTATNTGNLGGPGTGTLSGTVAFGMPGALNGDADTAAYFDGAQSKIDVPFAAELNSPIFSIEAWAKTSFEGFGYRSPLASRDDNPQKGFIFYANPNEEWQFWTGTGEQVGWNTVGGAFVEPGVWAHLVGTYDGTNKLFYVNGVLVGANQSRFHPNEAQVLRIGGSATESPVGDFFFNGDLDEVAVYNTVLRPERVVAHYNSGSAVPASPDVPPAFALQPVSLDRFKGETVTLTGLATGSLPLIFQWKKEDVDVPGGTNFSLVLTNLQPTDSGNYTLTVSNGAGELISDPAALTVADVSIPLITQQPRSRIVFPGTTAAYSVQASGSTTFQYQWQMNGQDLAGETNATLAITNVLNASLGDYKVVVSNAAGSTESEVATLSFPAPATKSYAETVMDDSPVGYWRLGETSGEIAEDSAGDNDGFLLNGVVLGQPGALSDDPNTAAGFDPDLQTKIDVPWSDALNPPEFTIEAWANVTGGAGHRSPVTSRGDGPQRGYIFYAEPGNTWQFWIGSSEPAGWVILQGPPVQNGIYAHLVGAYDGTTLSFYVNGVLAATATAVLAVNDSSPLRIGAGATEGDGNFFFAGDVDEVALFNTALSEERIIAHYVAGFPLTTPPSITVQPLSKVVPPGAMVLLNVSATGGQPLNYQWTFGNQNIAGGTNSTLTLSNVTTANVGDYFVIVSNAGGSITSSIVNVTIPFPSAKSYAQLVHDDGPLGYWRLGEVSGDVADDEMGANDGLYLNGVTLGADGAIINDTNTAARFSAALSQMVDVPWSDLLNPPIFTAEVWARVTGGADTYRSPLTSRADVPQRGYIFYAAPANNWQFWTGRGDSSGWDTIAGPAVEIDEWAHLVGTYDGTTKRFYVNGVEVGSSSTIFGINDSSVLRIGGGASEGPGSFFFEGDVDELAIYDKVLTPVQIVLHFLAGAPAPEPQITLGISRDGADIILTWNSGTLQSAPAVTGSWTAVAGASSPFTVNPAGQTAAFYRVLVQP
jgi:hypothetical protein